MINCVPHDILYPKFLSFHDQNLPSLECFMEQIMQHIINSGNNNDVPIIPYKNIFVFRINTLQQEYIINTKSDFCKSCC